MTCKTIWGINFINGGYIEAMKYLKQGGLMVVPAAPALATIKTDKKYHQALMNADFAIPDSGYMVLILKILKKISFKKFSGYAFLNLFLQENEFKKNNCLFLIDPTSQDSIINNQYLKKHNILIKKDYHYCAPIYNKNNIIDSILLNILERKKPKYIMINLGGGVQERLGSYLKNNLSYNPGIICTGAAIAFFTGKQAKIPKIIDTLYLGWLYRSILNPRIFIPRYLKGFKLLYMLINEKEL